MKVNTMAATQPRSDVGLAYLERCDAPLSTWKGTAFGGARGRTDVPKIVDWYMDGKINIDDLITHTLPLEQINHAFELMHGGESIRSVVLY
jgi:Zn-dependent alcohol dehydrogenase